MIVYSIALVIGFATAKFFHPKKRFVPQLKFGRFHIHHWIWGTVLLGVIYLSGYTHDLLIGAVTGVALQGLTYKNWSIFKVND
tara:strand:+ start:320 stop:568 length:249 start_codon:yes stop_codon:yes gene_type:complete